MNLLRRLKSLEITKIIVIFTKKKHKLNTIYKKTILDSKIFRKE